MNNISVLLVDDNDDFRQSTAWILESEDISTVDFASGESLLDAIDDDPELTNGSCVLTDLRMPGLSGLELIEALKQRRIKAPVVMMTAHGNVSSAVEAMKKGAASFIEKPFDDELLLETIRTTMSYPGTMLKNPEAAKQKLDRLTFREQQVLHLVCAGHINKTIADTLGISVKTVELHRSNMLSKLEVNNIQELVRLTLGYE